MAQDLYLEANIHRFDQDLDEVWNCNLDLTDFKKEEKKPYQKFEMGFSTC